MSVISDRLARERVDPDMYLGHPLLRWWGRSEGYVARPWDRPMTWSCPPRSFGPLGPVEVKAPKPTPVPRPEPEFEHRGEPRTDTFEIRPATGWSDHSSVAGSFGSSGHRTPRRPGSDDQWSPVRQLLTGPDFTGRWRW